MSKITIVEGNSNDKNNVRAVMVKGEKGDGATIDVSKTDGVATVVVEDNRGQQTFQISDGEMTKDMVVDNLTSTLTDQPLSANQGKQLKTLIDTNEEEFNEKFGENYYDEITYSKIRYQNTDVYITTIPKYDNDNNLIKLYVADGVDKSPLKYAQDNYTTFTMNASLWIKNTITEEGSVPSIIGNGVILRTNDMLEEGIADNLLYLGIKADRSIVEYQVNQTTAQQMLNDGCEQVFDVYWKVIENGVALDLTGIYSNEGNEATTTKAPRQCLGIKSDGTIIIITCDGRTNESAGLYQADLQALLIQYGCTDGWNLDGGGSTSTIIKGSKLNRNIDDNGTTDRFIRYTLNVKKETKNEEITKAYTKIGEEKQNVIQQIIPYVDSKIANQRIICGFTPASTEYNIIQDDTVYNPIKFNSTKVAPTIFASHFTLEKADPTDEYPTIFKFDRTGYKLIKANITLRCRTSGQKYLALYTGGSRLDRSIRTFSVNYSGSDVFITFNMEIIVSNTIPENPYEIRVYGGVNDAVVHGSVTIEYLE